MKNVSISSYSEEFQKIYRSYKLKLKAKGFDKLYKAEDRTEYLINEKRAELLFKVTNAQSLALDQPLSNVKKKGGSIDFNQKNESKFKMSKGILLEAFEKEDSIKNRVDLPLICHRKSTSVANHVMSCGVLKHIVVAKSSVMCLDEMRNKKTSVNVNSFTNFNMKCRLLNLDTENDASNSNADQNEEKKFYNERANSLYNIPANIIRTLETNSSTIDYSNQKFKKGSCLSKERRNKFVQFINKELDKEKGEAEALNKIIGSV